MAAGGDDDMLYSAFHDLREPLRGIAHYLEFLREDHGEALGEPGLARLQNIADLVARAERKLDALSELARVRRARLQPTSTDLGELAAGVVDGLAPRLAGDGASVRIDALPRLACDRDWVARLLEALLLNASTYSDRETRSVIVGWRGTDASGHAVLFVRDDGIGFAADQADGVFELFRRLHGRDAYGGGDGAGLTLAREIVRRHGGRIWAEAQPGEGATFYFTLGA